MPRLGMGELIVVLLIVIVLFGSTKLPQLGKGLGEGIRSFKKSLSGGEDDEQQKPTSSTSDVGRKQA